MGQIMKKILCSLLAVLMITSAVPVNAIALELEKVGESIPAEEEVAVPEIEESFNDLGDWEYETQSTPKDVNDTILAERVALLRNFVTNNSYGYKYFTTTGKSCDNADPGHPSDWDCAKCETTNLIKAEWIKNELGIMPSSTSLLPSPKYKYSGEIGSFYSKTWSCIGFTMIAHWFLYAQKASDNIAAEHIRTIDLTKKKSEIQAELDKYAKPGDMLIYRNSSSSSSYSHGAIYLGYNSSGILILDSNMGGSSGPTCKMQEYTMYYTSYKCVDISRATNYTEETVPVFGAEIIDPEGNVTDSIKIQKGDTFQLGIKIYPEDATNKAVTWSSRDTSVATVSSSGLVTAKGVGNTVIVAETKDGGYKFTCDVEVTEKTCTVHFDVGGGYISTPDMEVPEGTYITIPEEIPVCPGNVFTGWQTTDSAEGEWTKTKPSSGEYETGYKYYTWGYEHNSDYTYLYGDNKDELIEHIKKNSGTFGSYNPKKMRYFYLIENSDKGSSYYPGKSGSNYNYFNVDYISEDGKTGTASIYKTVFYFESKVYKQDATVAVIYQPGDSYLVTKDTVFMALWEEEPPTITVDSIEIFSGSAAELNIFIENNDATENLSFDLDLVYDKNAFEVAYVETFFPEDGVVSVNGDNVKYDVVDGETGAFSGLFLCVVLNVKDVEEKDYNFSINVNKWVNGFGSVEPKVVDGTIHVLNQAYTVTFDPGKGTGGPENITVTGNEFTVPTEIPVRENWNFLFWMGQNGKGYYPGNTYSITENLDLVAIFEPGWIPEISVENIKGKPGEAVEILVTVKNNTEIPDRYSFVTAMEPFGDYVSSLIFTPSGKNLPENGIMGKFTFDIPGDAKVGTVYSISMIFDEWIVGGFDMASSEMLKITNGSITVEEPAPQTYTVTYDSNGGSGAPSAQTKTEDVALTLSSAKPTRSGYVFLGWATYANATSAQYQPGDRYTANENVTLYAVWEKEASKPVSDTVISVGSVSCKAGDTVEVPVLIEKNEGFASIWMNIDFDESVLRLTDVKLGLANNCVFNAENKSIAGASASDITGDGTLFTLVFEISEDAKEGSYEVALEVLEFFNANDEDIAPAVLNGSIAVVEYVLGDANGDGKVTSRDATRILQYLVGSVGNDGIAVGASDFNGDGNVTSRDATAILRHLVGG